MDRPWIPKLWRQTATHTKVELLAAALTEVNSIPALYYLCGNANNDALLPDF